MRLCPLLGVAVLDAEADVAVAGVRFNLAIISDIYSEFTEKARILLRI